MRRTSWHLGRLVAARAVRTFGYGALSVVLAVELSRRGLSTLQVGLLFTAALWGGAAVAAGLPALLGHRLRPALMGCTVALAASGAVVATSSDFRLLAAAFALGLVSPTGQDVAAFQALEQAALATDTPGSRHVRVYALYDFSAFVAAAAGGLAVAALSTLARPQDPGIAPNAVVIWAFAALSAALLPLYAGLPDLPRPVALSRGDWDRPADRS